MTHTIAGTYSTLVTLGSLSDNPTTITATSQLNRGLQMTYNGLTVVNAGQIAVSTTTPGNYGVYLTDNGSLTNQSSGTISGYWAVYGAPSATAVVVNAGRIAGNTSGGIGVVLRAGGSINNQSGGTISGYYGIISNGPLTVVNAGNIVGTATLAAAGVWLSGESSITNQSGGTISGGRYGISGNGGAVTVANAGVIGGGVGATHFAGTGGVGGTGIDIASGSVTNQATITAGTGGGAGDGTGGVGGVGVDVASGSVTNQAAITGGAGGGGSGGAGDDNGGSGGSGVMIGTGSLTNTTTGIITGGYGHFGSTSGGAGGLGVTIAGGGLTNQGTIIGGAGGYNANPDASAVGGGGSGGNGVDIASSSLTNQGAIIGGAGGGVISGPGNIDGTGGIGVLLQASGTLINAGFIGGGSGGGGTADAVRFEGTSGNLLVLEQGFSFSGAIVASGTGNEVELLGSATAAVTANYNGLNLTNFQTIAFAPGADNYATLVIGNDAALPGTIAGFIGVHDTIDLTALSDTGNNATTSFNGLTDVLTVTGDNGSVALQLGSGDYAGSSWIAQNDGHGGTAIQGAVSPVISGTEAGQTTTDEAAINPMPGVSITDPNAGQAETITVTMSNNLNGTLSDVVGGTVNNGTYVVTGSTLFVTEALEALVFTPTAHQVPPGETVTTTFTITATDSAGASTSNSTTSVIATAVDDPPTITHTEINVGVPNQGTFEPFSGIAVNDPDAGGHIGTLTVTLAPSDGGTLGVLSGGTFDDATGVYTLVGTVAALNTALEDLVFTPAPPSNGSYISTTDFAVEVTDIGGQTVDNTVTVTAVTQDVPGFNGNGTSNSISVSPNGTDFAPPSTTPGVDNEAIVSGPTLDGTYSVPTGYQVLYLGGTVAASLSDNSVGDAALIGNSGNDTISASVANDTLTGGNGNNLFSASGANDVIGVTGASTVRTSGSDDTMYADGATLALIDTGTGDKLGLSGGTANVTLSGSGAALYGSSGSANVVDDGTNDAIGVGGGPLSATLGGSGTRVYGGSSALTVDETSRVSGVAFGLDSGPASITVGGGSSTIYGGSSSLSADVTGSNTRIGLANGVAAITLSGSGAEIFGGTNTLSVDDQGSGDTVAAYTGSTTVTAGGSNAVIVGGGGNLQLIGGANTATVYGGTGSTTVTGGAGAMTLYGGAGGMIDVNGGPGLITYQAGPGSETLNAAGNTGGAVINGGIDASGHDLLIGGSGNDSLFAGNGSDTFTGGGGSNEFVFYQRVVNGAAPHDVIMDFTSNDVVYLAGYGAGAASAAFNEASSSNGSTTLTLSDNTQITFLDVASTSTLLNHVISF